MKFPPDPIQRSFDRGNDELLNIEKKFRELIAETEQTRSLLNQLKRYPGITPKALEILYIVDNRKPAHDHLQPYDYNHSKEIGAMLGDLYSAIADNEQIVRRKELELGYLRHILLHACKEPEMNDLDENLRLRIHKEQELYRKQRMADKATWLAWLREKRAYNELRMKELDKNNPEKYRQMLQVIDQEVERVQRLTEAQIMENRAAFGHNPSVFEK